MLRLRRQRRADFLVALAAFLGVALLGVLPGILIAILVSVADVFRRVWMPHRTTLGRTEGLPGLHDTVTHPESVVLPRCPVYRFDAPLIFANAQTFRDDVQNFATTDPRPDWIVVAAEPISDVDTTACDMLGHLMETLESEGTRLVFAELKGSVRDKMRVFGLGHVDDPAFFQPTLDTALQAYAELHAADAQRRDGERGEGA